MKKYKVISDSITGLNGKTFYKDQKIQESDLKPGYVALFCSRGKLKEIKDYSIPADRKIRLAIVASVWGRPDVFRLFCVGIQYLVDQCTDLEIQLIVSGSAQDGQFANIKESKCYIEFLNYDCGIITKYIEIPNEPLAAKVNATTYACKDLNVDYVLCMGSDDIISPELLNEYGKLMRKGIDFIGVTDFYFYDTVSGKSLYWGGYREPYRKGHTAGAARAISARLMDEWDWMPWENKDSKVLDKSMQDKLKVTPHTIETFSMKEKGLFAVDIKSSTNMTPFSKWDNSEFIDTEIIKKQFPYIF